MFGAKYSKANWLQEAINTKQMNWAQNIQIEMRKYKAVECFEM